MGLILYKVRSGGAKDSDVMSDSKQIITSIKVSTCSLSPDDVKMKAKERNKKKTKENRG